MYHDSMNRALECFPDEWWAAEDMRENLNYYWKMIDAKTWVNYEFETSQGEYAYMDEEEASVYHALHSANEEDCDSDYVQYLKFKDPKEYERKKKYAEFEERANKDETLQACIDGSIYNKEIEEWVSDKTWSLTGESHDRPSTKTYEDSPELEDFEESVERLADDFTFYAWDCSSALNIAKELCETFAKLPKEQQIRFVMKATHKEAARRRGDNK